MKIRQNVLLSGYTTIGLGGKAEYFISCQKNNDIKEGLNFAKENNLRVVVISGGSNVVFPDEGFGGLILKIDTKGINFQNSEDGFHVRVSAGEIWDDFVNKCVDRSLQGVECLSGIPGSVGATPIQNVGAYGQEVKETIVSVNAIDRSGGELITFTNEECMFRYRDSRFKSEDKNKYIITDVVFKLNKNKTPEIKYEELEKYIRDHSNIQEIEDVKKKMRIIRDSVIELRKKKSMVIDENDPDSKSCGSFFKNPILDENEFQNFKKIIDQSDFPVFNSDSNYKLSAAWLVENAGFNKGYIKGGVGISKNHALAIININGTTEELKSLAGEIKDKVHDKFKVKLEEEPEVI